MGLECSTCGESRCAYKAYRGHLREGYHLEDRGGDGRIILKWILEK